MKGKHPISLAFPTLVGLYAVAWIISLATGLGDVQKLVAAGTYLAVPGALAAVQLTSAALAPRHRAAAIVLALSSTLSLAAIASDGDLGHAGLTTAEVGFQLLQAAVIAAVSALAWTSLARKPAIA